jgi:hypothetical protein
MPLNTQPVSASPSPAAAAFLQRREELSANGRRGSAVATAPHAPVDPTGPQRPTGSIDRPCPLEQIDLSRGVSDGGSPWHAATKAPEQVETPSWLAGQAPTWGFDGLDCPPTPTAAANVSPLRDPLPTTPGPTVLPRATADGSPSTWRAAQLAITQTSLELAGGALTYAYVLPLCPTLPAVGVALLGAAALGAASESVPNKRCSALLLGAAYGAQGALMCMVLPGMATASLATIAVGIGLSLTACAAILLGVSTLSTEHREALQSLSQSKGCKRAKLALNIVAQGCMVGARLLPLSAGGQAAALVGIVGAGVPAVALSLVAPKTAAVTEPDSKPPGVSGPVRFAVCMGMVTATVSWPAILRAL